MAGKTLSKSNRTTQQKPKQEGHHLGRSRRTIKDEQVPAVTAVVDVQKPEAAGSQAAIRLTRSDFQRYIEEPWYVLESLAALLLIIEPTPTDHVYPSISGVQAWIHLLDQTSELFFEEIHDGHIDSRFDRPGNEEAIPFTYADLAVYREITMPFMTAVAIGRNVEIDVSVPDSEINPAARFLTVAKMVNRIFEAAIRDIDSRLAEVLGGAQ